MLTVYLCLAMVLAVACTGAPVARLAQVRLRHPWLLWAALLDQVLVMSVLPDNHPTALALAHVASYLVAAACLVANRRLPGSWLIGAGGAVNGVVIALNGGTLPASPAALRAAGQHDDGGHFTNSAALAHPRLPWLGDVFATPAWLPGHNVFSVGDVLIWAGVAAFLWLTCRQVAGRHRRFGYDGRHAGGGTSPADVLTALRRATRLPTGRPAAMATD